MAPLDAATAPAVAPASARGLGALVPFRSPRREHDHTRLPIEGSIPSWLRGDLIRLCPAVFEKGPWRARHLFDGLGLLHAFSIDEGGVSFRSRMLRSEQWARIEDGRAWHCGFADGPQRSWLRRLVQPVPSITDNANVNLCRLGDDYVAMTETPHQLRFDPDTLETLGDKRYADALGSGLNMIAHPHFDRATRSVVSIAMEYSARSSIMLYRVGPDGGRREIVARHPVSDVPYIHDFGLTENHALLVMHPWCVRPTRMLWSNRGVVDHFSWDPDTSTRIAIVDRRQGSWREVEVPGAPFFVFHVANAFERPDGELVLDVLAYPDPSVVDALRVEALLKKLEIRAQLERIRIAPGCKRCSRERIVADPFEFPAIDHRRRSGRPYRYCWGAQSEGGGGVWRGEVVRVDTEHGDVIRYARSGWILGEPIFVPRDASDDRPDAEADGVLLSVASDLEHDRAELVVLDAQSLAPLATAALDDAIPVGFHGQFFPRVP